MYEEYEVTTYCKKKDIFILCKQTCIIMHRLDNIVPSIFDDGNHFFIRQLSLIEGCRIDIPIYVDIY